MRDDPVLNWPPLAGDARIGPGEKGEVDEWSLVLAAFGIGHVIEASPGSGYCLRVEPFQREAAVEQLRLWKGEAPLVTPPVAPATSWAPSLLLPFLLVIVHLRFLLPEESGRALVERALLSGTLLAAGEWWRPLTALLFHSGILHLVSNILPLTLLAPALSVRVGRGAAWATLLLASVAGNVAAALLRDPAIRSVGASTMVFAALGTAALLRDPAAGRTRLWLGVAGLGLAFLSLSSGESVDVAAHVFGFGAGVVAGVFWRLFLIRHPAGPGRRARLLLAGGTVLFCGLVLMRFFMA